jgi:thiol:disulfide interchange protein DsbD
MVRKAVALIAFLVLVATITAGCSIIAGSGKVDWLTDWSDALSTAQAQNKPILINFYADVCPACVRMDQTTFSDEELGSFLNSNFVCLRSNVDRSTLYAKYDIWSVPTIVFTEPDGYDKQYEIDSIIGYVNATSFYQKALDALEEWQT